MVAGTSHILAFQVYFLSFFFFLQHNLQGHISDVNTCRFFPSGKVVLSGGADLRLKIWSAEDGSCPVTLKGHTGGEHINMCFYKPKQEVSIGSHYQYSPIKIC